jgi:hypothetical protein
MEPLMEPSERGERLRCPGRARSKAAHGSTTSLGERALAARLKHSDVEACVLEVEVALDEVHDVVVDPSLAPEVDDRSPFGVEELAA